MTASEIKQVKVDLIYDLRQRILRPNGDIDGVKFDGDNENTTEHYAIYVCGEICGCVSLYEAKNKHFFQGKQCQLRGMAVESNCQGKGYGAMLLSAAEKRAKEKNAELLWLNARDYAVGFYKKFGYECVGDYFDIPNVCKHIVMFKKLHC